MPLERPPVLFPSERIACNSVQTFPVCGLYFPEPYLIEQLLLLAFRHAPHLTRCRHQSYCPPCSSNTCRACNDKKRTGGRVIATPVRSWRPLRLLIAAAITD